jgi:hypothetical protein
MKPDLLVSTILVVGATHLAAQNLVPNGSFEDYTLCPASFGYAHYATGWQNLHTNSTDYFHRCQPNITAGVPYNATAYQEPAHGDGYVGIVTTFPGLAWYREIVGIELTDPLQVGVPVCLSFKMAVGGFGSWDGGSALYTSKGVGMRFFNVFPTDWQAYLYPSAAALYVDVVPTDTAIWYVMSGEFLPDSNYTHLAIGNFFPDSVSSISVCDSTGYANWGVSYALIDDVRVSYDLAYCNLNVGVTGRQKEASIRAYPSPFEDKFAVTLDRPADGPLQWELLDACGRRVLQGTTPTGTLSFFVTAGSIRNGSYLLNVKDDEGAFAPIRLVSNSPH